jgi:hypothetical protein
MANALPYLFDPLSDWCMHNLTNYEAGVVVILNLCACVYGAIDQASCYIEVPGLYIETT